MKKGFWKTFENLSLGTTLTNNIVINDGYIKNISVSNLYANNFIFGDIAGNTFDVNIINSTSINSQNVYTTTIFSNTLNINEYSTIGGYLDITAITNIQNNFNLTGNANIQGSIDVSGETNIQNNLIIGGNTIVNGTILIGDILSVSGATYLNNTLSVSGDTIFNKTLNVVEGTYLDNILSVYGGVYLDNIISVYNTVYINKHISVNSNVYINDSLSLSGIGFIDNSISINDNIFTNNNLSVTKNAYINNSISIGGITHIDNNLIVNNFVYIDNILSINDTAFIDNNISVSGTVFILDKLSVNDSIFLNNTLTVGNQLLILDSMSVANVIYLDNNLSISNTLFIDNITPNNISININGNSNILGELTILGNTLIGNKLSIYDDTYLSNNIFVSGYISTSSELYSDNIYGNHITTIGNTFLGDSLSVNLNIYGNGLLSISDTIFGNSLSIVNNTFIGNSLTVLDNTYIGNQLSINNNTFIDNSLSVSRNIYTSNSLSVSHDIYTENSLSVSYNIYTENSLSVSHNTYIGNSLSIFSHTYIGNSLSIYGDTYIENSLSILNDTYLGNSLSIFGDTYIENNLSLGKSIFVGEILSIANNAYVKGDLIVDGFINFSGDVQFTGNLNLDTDLDIRGRTFIKNTLSVSDITYLNNSVSIHGITNIDNTLSVQGNTFINSLLSVNKTTYLNNDLSVLGNTYLNSSLSVNKESYLNSSLSVNKESYLENILSIHGNTYIDDNITVSGFGNFNNLYVNDTISVSNNVFINNDISIIANTYISGNLSLNSDLSIGGILYTNSRVSIADIVYINSDLSVYKDTFIQGNVFINQDLTVLGNRFTANITSIEISDPVLVLGVGSDISFNRGIIFDRSTNNVYTGLLRDQNHWHLVNNLVLSNVDVNILNLSNVIYDDISVGKLGSEAISISNNLSVGGIIFTNSSLIASNNLSVSNNVYINKSISIAQDIIVNGLMNIIGSTKLNDNLTVTSTGIFNDSLSVSGPVILNNTLSVLGMVLLNNTLSVSGPVIINNSLSVNGPIVFNDSLSIDGTVVLNNSLSINGITVLENTLNVSGQTILNNILSVAGSILVNNALSVSGTTVFNGSLSVSGPTVLGSTVSVNGQVILSNLLSVADNIITIKDILANNISITNTLFSSRLSVSNNINIGNNLSVTNNTFIANNLSVANNAIIGNNISVGGNITTSRFGLSDGTSANPALYFNSDTDTGIFRIPNAVGFSINGREGLGFYDDGYLPFIYVNPSDNYGSALKLYSPDIPALSISQHKYGIYAFGTQTGTGYGNPSRPGYLALYDENVGVVPEAERITVSTDGKVGINQVTPQHHLDVRGNIRTSNILIANTLSISSIAYMNTLSISGTVNISSTLSILGVVNLDNTLSISGASYLKNSLSVLGATNINSTLSVSGATNINSTLSVSGATNINSTLSVSGTTNLNNTLSISGIVYMSNILSVSGTTFINNNLSVQGDVNINNTLNVSGATNIRNFLSILGATNINSTLSVSGATYLNNTLSVANEAFITGNVNITGNYFVNGNLLSVTGASNTIILKDGTVSVPAISFETAPLTGIYKEGGTSTSLSIGNSIINRGSIDNAQTSFVRHLPFGSSSIGYKLESWRYYSYTATRSITPLLLEQINPTQFILRAIGTTRSGIAGDSGVLSFGTVEGNNTIYNANYCFGWKDGTQTSSNQGVIVYDSSGDPGQYMLALTGNSSQNITGSNIGTTLTYGNTSLGNREYSYNIILTSNQNSIVFGFNSNRTVDITNTNGAGIILNDTDNNYGPYMQLNGNRNWSLVSYKVSNGNTGYFNIVDATANVEKLTIATSNCIGILNNNPQYTLDVTGNINVTGNYLVNGNVLSVSGGGGGSSELGFYNVSNWTPNTTQTFTLTTPMTSLGKSKVTIYKEYPAVNNYVDNTWSIVPDDTYFDIYNYKDSRGSVAISGVSGIIQLTLSGPDTWTSADLYKEFQAYGGKAIITELVSSTVVNASVTTILSDNTTTSTWYLYAGKFDSDGSFKIVPYNNALRQVNDSNADALWYNIEVAFSNKFNVTPTTNGFFNIADFNQGDSANTNHRLAQASNMIVTPQGRLIAMFTFSTRALNSTSFANFNNILMFSDDDGKTWSMRNWTTMSSSPNWYFTNPNLWGTRATPCISYKNGKLYSVGKLAGVYLTSNAGNTGSYTTAAAIGNLTFTDNWYALHFESHTITNTGRNNIAFRNITVTGSGSGAVSPTYTFAGNGPFGNSKILVANNDYLYVFFYQRDASSRNKALFIISIDDGQIWRSTSGGTTGVGAEINPTSAGFLNLYISIATVDYALHNYNTFSSLMTSYSFYNREFNDYFNATEMNGNIYTVFSSSTTTQSSFRIYYGVFTGSGYSYTTNTTDYLVSRGDNINSNHYHPNLIGDNNNRLIFVWYGNTTTNGWGTYWIFYNTSTNIWGTTTFLTNSVTARYNLDKKSNGDIYLTISSDIMFLLPNNSNTFINLTNSLVRYPFRRSVDHAYSDSCRTVVKNDIIIGLEPYTNGDTLSKITRIDGYTTGARNGYNVFTETTNKYSAILSKTIFEGNGVYNTSAQNNPVMAYDRSNNIIYLCWNGNNTTYPSTNVVFLSKSSDNGETWSTPAIVSDPSYASLQPKILLDSGTLHITWYAYSAASASRYNIFYRNTTDGSTFSSIVNITSQSANDQTRPQMISNGSGSIFIFWYGVTPSTGGLNKIQWSYNTSNGVGAWTTGNNLFNHTNFNSYNQTYPRVYYNTTNNTVYLIALSRSSTSTVYDNLYLTYSSNNGSSWTVSTQLINVASVNASVSVTSGDNENDIVVDSNGRIHVISRTNENSNGRPVYVTYSDNNGTTWTNSIVSPEVAYFNTNSPLPYAFSKAFMTSNGTIYFIFSGYAQTYGNNLAYMRVPYYVTYNGTRYSLPDVFVDTFSTYGLVSTTSTNYDSTNIISPNTQGNPSITINDFNLIERNNKLYCMTSMNLYRTTTTNSVMYSIEFTDEANTIFGTDDLSRGTNWRITGVNLNNTNSYDHRGCDIKVSPYNNYIYAVGSVYSTTHSNYHIALHYSATGVGSYTVSHLSTSLGGSSSYSHVYPSLAISPSGYVCCVWSGLSASTSNTPNYYRIYYSISTNGTTFSTPILADNTSATNSYIYPVAAFDSSNNLYLAYVRNSYIYVAKITAANLTNASPNATFTQISTQTFSPSSNNVGIPRMVCVNNKLHLVFSGTNTGFTSVYQIWYTSSTDGITWSALERINDSSLNSVNLYSADIAVNSNNDIFVSYNTMGASSRVYCAYKLNGSLSFSNDMRINSEFSSGIPESTSNKDILTRIEVYNRTAYILTWGVHYNGFKSNASYLKAKLYVKNFGTGGRWLQNKYPIDYDRRYEYSSASSTNYYTPGICIKTDGTIYAIVPTEESNVGNHRPQIFRSLESTQNKSNTYVTAVSNLAGTINTTNWTQITNMILDEITNNQTAYYVVGLVSSTEHNWYVTNGVNYRKVVSYNIAGNSYTINTNETFTGETMTAPVTTSGNIIVILEEAMGTTSNRMSGSVFSTSTIFPTLSGITGLKLAMILYSDNTNTGPQVNNVNVVYGANAEYEDVTSTYRVRIRNLNTIAITSANDGSSDNAFVYVTN